MGGRVPKVACSAVDGAPTGEPCQLSADRWIARGRRMPDGAAGPRAARRQAGGIMRNGSDLAGSCPCHRARFAGSPCRPGESRPTGGPCRARPGLSSISARVGARRSSKDSRVRGVSALPFRGGSSFSLIVPANSRKLGHRDAGSTGPPVDHNLRRSGAVQNAPREMTGRVPCSIHSIRSRTSR